MRAAVHYAAYEFEARPDFVYSTDFHIYQSLHQAKFSHDVLGEVGLDSSRALRPGDPEYSFVGERTREVWEFLRQICPPARKMMNKIGGGRQSGLNGRPGRQRSEEGPICGRRTERYDPGICFDSKLLRQATLRVPGSHMRITGIRRPLGVAFLAQ